MTASLEPATSAEALDPGGEEFVRPADVLTFVREVAARRDPPHAHIYRTMSPGRIKDATVLARQLIGTHLELRRRQGRGARTGRREHGRRVYALLDGTNVSNLVLAQAFLEVACILPVSEPHRDT